MVSISAFDSSRSRSATERIPEPAPGSRMLREVRPSGIEKSPAIKAAVSLLVKNCPYFFLLDFGMWSMYSTVAAQTWSIIFIICKLHYVALSLTLPTAKGRKTRGLQITACKQGLHDLPKRIG